MAPTEVQEPLMAMFSRRPASLAHLSDEAAARVLSKHFGNIVEAAKDLGVDRKDLRRLTWSNPAILDAAHERIDLFVITMRGELVGQAMHGSSRVRQCAIDRMYRVAAIPDHPIGKAFASLPLGLLARAPRVRSVDAEAAAATEKARLPLEQEVAAERAREAEADRQRERAREAEVEASRRRERTAALKPIPAGRPSVPAAQSGSLWPAEIRRPSRGGWR